MMAAMKSRRLAIVFAVALAVVPLARAADRSETIGETGPGVPAFWVRPGYRVSVAAEPQAEARFVAFDDRGTLYLSQPGRGAIVALTDPDGDGVYDKSTEFVGDRPTAHGLDFADGWLWFTTSGGVFKARDADGDGKADEVVTVLKGLPEGGGHNLRSICVDGDHFYTSIGDSSNLGPDEAERTDRQKIWRYDLNGSGKTLFVSGIRNTEKLRLQPGTGELWGCDHGSDNFGAPFGEKQVKGDGLSNQAITDLNPPEEFNHYVAGGFYGHPWITGDRVPRQEYVGRPDIATLAAKTTPPAYKGGAHWANNGWCFATKDMIGPAGDAYIAYHGSWNNSRKVGYRVQHVTFDPATREPYGGMPLVVTLGGDDDGGGSLDDRQKVLGRPCDVVEAPDGTLLFTDTQTRKIYRISRIK